MTNVSVRRSRDPSGQPPAIQYFNPALVSERDAGTLFHRVLAAIDKAQQFKSTATTIHVRHSPAEISSMFDERSRLCLFAVRLIQTNELVLKGNRDGLLPMSVEAPHV